MMVFYARNDESGALAGVHMNGGDFDTDATFSAHLLAQADARFLRRDGDTITITCDEGVARYHVTEVDPVSKAVHATLVSVERATEMAVSG